MPKSLISILFICLLGCSESDPADFNQFLTFQARLVGDTLVSSAFPECTISFDESFEYIGSDNFILYGVARCEIHLFAERDSGDSYKRIYWIQYEGYLPSKYLPFPQNLKPGGLKYNYSKDPSRHLIDGREFYARGGKMNIDLPYEEITAEFSSGDSDFLRAARLLYKNGIDINDEVLSTRLVHLDPTKKKELMIIYYESIENNNWINNDFLNAETLWEERSKEILRRVEEGIRLKFD